MATIYHVSVRNAEFKTIGVCALTKHDAAIIAQARIKDYGYIPEDKVSVDTVKRICSNAKSGWDVGSSIIY